jgi:hypothetical protein
MALRLLSPDPPRTRGEPKERMSKGRLSAADDPLDRIRPAERDAIEEPQRARDLVDVRPGVLLVDQMQLVGTDLLHADPIRATLEMPAKLRDRVDVGLLRRARQVADCHVLDHALA